MIDVTCRLVADINELRPGLMEVKAWALARNEATGLAPSNARCHLMKHPQIRMLENIALTVSSITRRYYPPSLAEIFCPRSVSRERPGYFHHPLRPYTEADSW